MDIVELRSDTFTRPTREMLKAMADAELGDDVWGEDPTAISLQEHCAEMFGMEAGLFVPSGTMGNETALKALTNPGDDVIVESRSHIVLYEHGAPGVISGVVLRLIDGARIFNASVASGVPVRDYAAEVDALSFCFSKGLGAPVGSMLLGTQELIDRARVIRQMLGGGMRQVGLLCAAARVAVDTMVDRLAEDHENARALAEGFADAAPDSVDPSTVDTNMVYVDLPGRDADAIVRSMWDDGVRVAALGPTRIRAVTNKEVDRPGIERAIASFAAATRSKTLLANAS